MLSDHIQTELQENSLSRIHSHMEQHDCAIITAFRGGNTRAVNTSRNQELQAQLLAARYGVTGVDGRFIENIGAPGQKEVAERSFFVVNLPDDPNFISRLSQLAAHFGQESVLVKPRDASGYLLGTIDQTDQGTDAFPGLGKTVPLPRFHAGSVEGAFFTTVGGRPFQFLDEYHLRPNASKFLIERTLNKSTFRFQEKTA